MYWITEGTFYRQNISMYSNATCFASVHPEIQELFKVTYTSIGVFSINPFDENQFAYSIDSNGSELFALYIHDIGLNSTLLISNNTYNSLEWAQEGLKTLVYYNIVDEISGTPRFIYSTCISCHLKTKVAVYKEDDISLITELESSSDGSLIILKVSGQVTSECLVMSRINSTGFKSITGRKSNVYTQIDYGTNNYYIRTNENADTFKILKLNSAGFQTLWYDNEIYCDDFTLFENFLVIFGWRNASRVIKLLDLWNLLIRELDILNSVSSIAKLKHKYKSNYFRFSNSSFLDQVNYYSVDLDTRVITRLSATNDGFSKSFIQSRIYVPSQDNVLIPITLCFNKTFHDKLLMNVYGAYGGISTPDFNADIFPLLNRGFVYAICHPRGDADFGPDWYKKGKFQFKINSIKDTIACMKGLVDLGYVEKGKIALSARSAGGLVAGGVMNIDQEYASVIVAQVPFVDSIGDMIDEKVPWTAYEWTEWGDPRRDEGIFKAMLEYSPYHNLKLCGTKSMMVTAGMNDARVAVWEPVKYVARMRRVCSIKSNLLLRVDEGGHQVSDRMNEIAHIYAFILDRI